MILIRSMKILFGMNIPVLWDAGPESWVEPYAGG